MSLTNIITQQITEAMKTGDSFKLGVLRMAKGALQNAEIAKDDHQLTENDEISVIQKEIKKRHDSATMYTTGGRLELAEKEQKEAALLMQYLPAQATDQQIEEIVTKAITSVGATSKADMGRVMGMVMPQLKGQAESARISAIVMRLLG